MMDQEAMHEPGPPAVMTGPSRNRGKAKLRGLARDPSANVLITTALLLPILVTCAGMAIDFSLTYQTKTGLQQSLDAAALAAAKMYGTTQDPVELEKAANAYFYANNGRDVTDNTKLVYGGIANVNGLNVLQISATKDKPTFFGPAIKALTGGAVDYTKAHISEGSKVVIENKSIELSLVLDNSGSMRDAPASGGKAKIETLREAMKSLAESLMAKNTAATNSANAVKVSIVPFSSSVKVGASHADDAWMDTKGFSSIHHDNFSWKNYKDPVTGLGALAVPIVGTSPQRNAYRQIMPQDLAGVASGNWLTRFTIYKNAKRNGSPISAGWKGCVESRPNGLAFTDDDASESNPDSLFVPSFAPAEPTNSGLSNAYLDYGPSNNSDNATKVQYQRDVQKYFDTNVKSTINEEASRGPSYGCYSIPAIQPLTEKKDTILDSIKAQTPDGGTNIPEGLAWGWRTLSAKAPFTEGKASNAKSNMKVLILVTDGENTYYPTYTATGKPVDYDNINMSLYGSYGYGQVWSKATPPVASTGHIFDGLSTTTKKSTAANYYSAMNEMLGKVCTNIKNDGKSAKTDGSDGIIVATIAFDLPDKSPVKTLLQNCASKGVDGKSNPLYYDAKKSSDLVNAINDLVGQISSLRIYR